MMTECCRLTFSSFHGNHLSFSISKTYFHQRLLCPSNICSHWPLSYSSLSVSLFSPCYISKNYFQPAFRQVSFDLSSYYITCICICIVHCAVHTWRGNIIVQ